MLTQDCFIVYAWHAPHSKQAPRFPSTWINTTYYTHEHTSTTLEKSGFTPDYVNNMPCELYLSWNWVLLRYIKGIYSRVLSFLLRFKDRYHSQSYINTTISLLAQSKGNKIYVSILKIDLITRLYLICLFHTKTSNSTCSLKPSDTNVSFFTS